jgi:hypothetical protein
VVGEQLVSPGHLRDEGNTSLDMVLYDPVKMAWWYYASETPSGGWEKMTGMPRPHVPHFAELEVGGFVPRVIYDWFHNKFYATPHYNRVPEKGLENPYIKLSKGHTWTTGDVETLATKLTAF